MSPKVKPGDSLIALKAIALAPGLSSSARRIGAAILDHFNRKTGQCDPSLGRLSYLLKIDRKTVWEGVESLVASGFFRRTTHGGKSHRNSYFPEWEMFRQVTDEWSRNFSLSHSDRGSKDPTELGSNGPTGVGQKAQQTCLSNLSKRTSVNGGAENASRIGGGPKSENGQPEGRASRARREIIFGPPGGKAPSRDLVSRNRAWLRVEEDFRKAVGQRSYEKSIHAIDEAMIEQATAAELASRGGGLRSLLGALPLSPTQNAADGLR